MQKSLCKVKDAYKLKYVVVPREDLIQIYILYIRSLLVYCSTLTTEQSNKLERVQKLCLKIILGDCYDGYENALEACGLENLSKRRESRCLKFGLKSLLHPIHSDMFPVNPQVLSNPYNIRSSEHFTVNSAKSESYKKSAIPYIQRLLNTYEHFSPATA